MLAIIYLSGIAAPISQFKVPPMMRQLMAEFDISLAASGWLMSLFTLVGLICAIPIGILIKRFGVKEASLAALGLLLAGSVTGIYAPSVTVMLASRIMEGAGMCIFSISAPAAIAAWFPPNKRGMPTGIWATWVPAGTIIMYIAAPMLGVNGWRHVWWFAIGYTVLMLLLCLIFFQMPETNEETEKNKTELTLPAGFIRNICLLAATFMLFNIITISTKSYLPVFLEIARNYPPGKASGTINIMVIVSLFTGPLTGALSDKTGSRKFFLVMGCVIACIAAAVPFTAGGLLPAAALFMLGVSCGNVATVSFASASEIAGSSNRASLALSVVIFGQYMGMSAGPVLFSTTAASFGWQTAALFLVPVAFLASICAFSVKIK